MTFFVGFLEGFPFSSFSPQISPFFDLAQIYYLDLYFFDNSVGLGCNLGKKKQKRKNGSADMLV